MATTDMRKLRAFPLRPGELLPARKAFCNGGSFIPAGDWRACND